jgi:hypothetical protein
MVPQAYRAPAPQVYRRMAPQAYREIRHRYYHGQEKGTLCAPEPHIFSPHNDFFLGAAVVPLWDGVPVWYRAAA